MFFSPKSGGVDWLLVCLGNPGDQYENTRHNAGFMVADELADRLNVPVQRLKFRALTNTATLGGRKVLLMKPMTYMNLSGEAVHEAKPFYKIPPSGSRYSRRGGPSPGKIRVRKTAVPAATTALENIIAHLGTDQFPRVRVGVGQKPHPACDMADWVLGKFQGEDKKAVKLR